MKRHVQENGMVQYTQKSIIATTGTGKYSFMNKVYGRSGRVFLSAFFHKHTILYTKARYIRAAYGLG